MILKQLIVVGLVGVLLGCVGTPKSSLCPDEAQTHAFGVYLVSFTAVQPWVSATLGDLATLPLAKEPVISGADILNYDFAHHTMVVKPEALLRLPHPSVWGMPFVVVADGQRVYLGAFGTVLSSSSIPVPTILVDFREFSDSLVIGRAYPFPGFAEGPDPRSDDRVRVALAGLNKLK